MLSNVEVYFSLVEWGKNGVIFNILLICYFLMGVFDDKILTNRIEDFR